MRVPEGGFGITIVQMADWLASHVGRGNYAWHSGGRRSVAGGIVDTTAFYFRDPGAAVALLDAFDLTLADGTTSVTYVSPMRPPDGSR